VSGTLAGPSLNAAGGAIRLQRLWVPIAVALAMHAAILAVRPGGLTGSYVAPSQAPGPESAARGVHR